MTTQTWAGCKIRGWTPLPHASEALALRGRLATLCAFGPRDARRLLDDLLARDPNFLPAIMSRVRIDFTELYGGFGDRPEGKQFEQLVREADVLSARAVELAPDYAAAWDRRSQVFALQQRWDPALAG